ncbi:MAG: 3-phosphoshikimate 1-carboxyvinyltransferase [Defluviitaleaceae bacterium]|nr:3-phosphoshikimate 1-carboxyvinyltransferase [Defluviitaleaceae bacterium]
MIGYKIGGLIHVTITVLPAQISGTIAAIPSKSHLHRLLIYAALSDAPTTITCRDTKAEDITATIDCLSALGAEICRNETGFAVRPADRSKLSGDATTPLFFPCGESGSTLRFMLPVVNALGLRGAFEMKGRLPERPLAPLDAQLKAHGVKLWREGNILHCEGQLTHGTFTLPGDVSSQYISGLLMALPLLEKPSRLEITGFVESAGYIDLTLQVAETFTAGDISGMPHVPSKPNAGDTSGMPHVPSKPNAGDTSGMPHIPSKPECASEGACNLSPTLSKPNAGNTSGMPHVPSKQESSPDSATGWACDIQPAGAYKSPGRTAAEGDWSNAAFWLCAGAMPGGSIRMTGLNKNSSQGDREICEILSRTGANVTWDGDDVVVSAGKLNATEIDGRAVPDLIPVLAAVASVARGTTVIRNASRLRIKESDRLATTAQTINALGGNVSETSDGLIITGTQQLRGGTVDAAGDHRIAMTAAVAHTAAPVTVTGAQAVNKSYPDFWNDLRSLGRKAD